MLGETDWPTETLWCIRKMEQEQLEETFDPAMHGFLTLTALRLLLIDAIERRNHG